MNISRRYLTSMLSALLIIAVLPVFVEPFRVDESWQIYRARLDISSMTATDAMSSLLRMWFYLIDDLWISTVSLRVVALLAYLITIYLCYRIALQSLLSNDKSSAYIFSLAIASWLALNRGFEIRPEMFANLSILLAITIITGANHRHPGVPMVGVSLLLFIPTVFSLRYFAICTAIFFMLISLAFSKKHKEYYLFGFAFLMTAMFVKIALAVHVYFFDLAEGLKYANQWSSSNDRSLGYAERLRYAISSPVVYIFAGFWISVIIFFLLVLRNAFREQRYTLAIYALSPLLAFYLFFFIKEVRPHRYVHTLEAVAFLSSASVAYKFRLLKIKRPGIPNLLFSILIAACVFISAVFDLKTRYIYVDNLLRDAMHFPRVSKGVETMRHPESLIQQILSREEFCRQHAHLDVIVADPRAHPFCGHDVGSFYNSGFTTYPFEIRFSAVRQSSGPIFTSAALTQELGELGFTCREISRSYHICQY